MKHILLFIFTVLLSLPSYGSVVIMGTRVIYPAEQKSINVRLNNGDSTPSLIQAWLDTGDPSSLTLSGCRLLLRLLFSGWSRFPDRQCELCIREKNFRQTGNHCSG